MVRECIDPGSLLCSFPFSFVVVFYSTMVHPPCYWRKRPRALTTLQLCATLGVERIDGALRGGEAGAPRLGRSA